MNGHLSPEILAALADGELQPAEFSAAEQHLAACARCMHRALSESLLRRSAAHAGRRYPMPEPLQARIQRAIAAQQEFPSMPPVAAPRQSFTPATTSGIAGSPRWSLWTAAWLVALLLVSAGSYVARDLALRSARSSAFIVESVDEHITALAAAAPEVISSDRHTVKPWFQGRLPFSFNLPAALPPDITLDGANLTALDGRPAAELLFSIGKHRASVFLVERGPASPPAISRAEHHGFHLDGFQTPELDFLAVSDADPAQLHALAAAIQRAQ